MELSSHFRPAKVRRVVIFRKKRGDGYWHAIGANGKKIAAGGEGYKRIGACRNGMEGVVHATDRGIPIQIIEN